MSISPKNEFEGAQRILWRYYERVVREMAEDIIKNTEDFEEPFGDADSILEKHYCRLSRIGCAYAYLRSLASKEKPEGAKPLAKDEFRCFGCGGVIKADDISCKLCGWTWR
jgi:hypothetical protein